MGGGTVDDGAVADAESGAVPGALDDVAVELSFGERSTEMRADLADGIDPALAANEQHAGATGFDAAGLAIAQLIGVEHGCPFSRRRVPVRGVIDADPLAIHEMAAEICGGDRDGIADRGERPSGVAAPALALREGDGEEGRRGRIQQAMGEADAACRAVGGLPVGQAGEGRANGSGESNLNGQVGARAIVDGVEDDCGGPRSEREVGEDGVQGVAEPDAVQEVADFAARRARRIERASDGALQARFHGIEPLLPLHQVNCQFFRHTFMLRAAPDSFRKTAYDRKVVNRIHRLQVETRGKGLYEITDSVERWLAQQGAGTGLLTVFIQHTSASLTVQENADPDVRHDLNEFFGRIVPEDNRLYRHTVEGPDDMPAHIRSALTLTQLSIPVEKGRMTLGTWQGIYVFEHRARGHRRSVVLHLLADS